MQGELKDTVRYMPLTDKLIDNISTHDVVVVGPKWNLKHNMRHVKTTADIGQTLFPDVSIYVKCADKGKSQH